MKERLSQDQIDSLILKEYFQRASKSELLKILSSHSSEQVDPLAQKLAAEELSRRGVQEPEDTSAPNA